MKKPTEIAIDGKKLPYKIGENLQLTNKKEALIIGVEVRINGSVNYLVEHFNGDTFETNWFNERELKCFFNHKSKGYVGF